MDPNKLTTLPEEGGPSAAALSLNKALPPIDDNGVVQAPSNANNGAIQNPNNANNENPSTVSKFPPHNSPMLIAPFLGANEDKDRFKIKKCVNCKSLPCRCAQDRMKQDKKLMRKLQRREFLQKCVIM